MGDDDAHTSVGAHARLGVVQAGDARGVLERLPPREVVEVEAPIAAVGDVAVDDQRLVGREIEEAERVVRGVEAALDVVTAGELVVGLGGARVEHVLVPVRERAVEVGAGLGEPEREVVRRERVRWTLARRGTRW